jgi:NAD-dependent dihydropyrimidine dehydrogenase PreA subunit
MTVRKLIEIDEELCNGCGDCVPACDEGAIEIVDGKARLVSERLCDGLGACLGDCPQGAIRLVETEAEPFDEAAVAEHLGRRAAGSPRPTAPAPLPAFESPAPASAAGGCPGSRMQVLGEPHGTGRDADAPAGPSALRQWPVQLHLVPPQAPYFQGADLLLAADCTAFAMGDFHRSQLAGRALAIACPKLDHAQDRYLDKLVALIDHAGLRSITVLVMEVPCCRGLLTLAQTAVERARRRVPVNVKVVSVRGDVVAERAAV